MTRIVTFIMAALISLDVVFVPNDAHRHPRLRVQGRAPWYGARHGPIQRGHRIFEPTGGSHQPGWGRGPGEYDTCTRFCFVRMSYRDQRVVRRTAFLR